LSCSFFLQDAQGAWRSEGFESRKLKFTFE